MRGLPVCRVHGVHVCEPCKSTDRYFELLALAELEREGFSDLKPVYGPTTQRC